MSLAFYWRLPSLSRARLSSFDRSIKNLFTNFDLCARLSEPSPRPPAPSPTPLPTPNHSQTHLHPSLVTRRITSTTMLYKTIAFAASPSRTASPSPPARATPPCRWPRRWVRPSAAASSPRVRPSTLRVRAITLSRPPTPFFLLFSSRHGKTFLPPQLLTHNHTPRASRPAVLVQGGSSAPGRTARRRSSRSRSSSRPRAVRSMPTSSSGTARTTRRARCACTSRTASSAPSRR